MNPELVMLKQFLSGLNKFMGRGASRILAESIAMKPSAFSRFITDDKRQFDEKTLMAYALMTQLKQEVVEGAELAAEGYMGQITFREWKLTNGETKYTWFPTKQETA